jgi:hypothetical protein
VSVVMLAIATVLMLTATFAFGLGGLIDDLPVTLPFDDLVGQVASWSVSILSAVLLFAIIFKLLPNVQEGWRDVLPGALLCTALFFLITSLFPLYVKFFPPNAAYATFGLFLVFTFWLYLLGLTFVLGAELNAFLLQPARSAAVAESAAKATRGHVALDDSTGRVVAQAEGDAPPLQGTDQRPLTADPQQSAPRQGEAAPAPRPAHAAQSAAPGQGSPRPGPARSDQRKPGLGGRLVGLAALAVAAVMLKKDSGRQQEPAR